MIDQAEGLSSMAARLSESGWNYIDVLGAMQNADVPKDVLYYRTDHHWTTRGAFIAYTRYSLDRGMEHVAYHSETASEEFLGTHFSKSKRIGTKPDVIQYAPLPVDRVTIDGKEVDGLYDFEKLETRDQYAMFLYGNNGVTIIENDSAPEGTLLILKDSYANCFVPFITQNFSRVIVVDLRSLTTPLSELLATEQPDELLMVYNYKNLISDSDIPRIKY